MTKQTKPKQKQKSRQKRIEDKAITVFPKAQSGIEST
jgi:hypothetical protein